ncbi:MAG: 16S rRNA (adenine(1518)-N(6)/adenine(1519)-N(6))-dimethyltransferase RsmA [Dehalococcoidia bacterium]|nr:16S rRNA (adenine(1518)-N(6)/adenine(1519)-N(6))-dimethyltransferase RsmA [Dehalococcoidia bacterium]
MAISRYSGLNETIKKLGLKPRKRLGQNFLVSDAVLSKIIQAAELSKEDVVLEVGPGLGILTKALGERVQKVIGVELDNRLAGLLKKQLADKNNIFIINGDILKISLKELLGGITSQQEGKYSEVGKKYKVVANLPYYITSPVLRYFLESEIKPAIMVIMVQKEVAQAIAAKPGDMSLLSVSVQLYGSPAIIDYISPDSFYPPPNVDSAIVRIDVFEKPAVKIDDLSLFFRVVTAGYSSRRKQIHNSLRQGLQIDQNIIRTCLGEADIDGSRRAQSLSLVEWGKLYGAISNHMVTEKGN